MSPESWAVNAGLVIACALALAANLLLLLVFFRRRGLRTVSNRFVINLLMTNLISSLILIPLLLLNQEFQSNADEAEQHSLVFKSTNHTAQLHIENVQFSQELTTPSATDVTVEDEGFELEILNFREEGLDEEGMKIRHFKRFLRSSNQSEMVEPEEKIRTGRMLCYISEGSTSLVCTASILSILLIAIDQYFAVTHPLRYHTFIDKFKSVILLVTTWIVSLVFGVMGAFVKTDSNLWNFCVSSYTGEQSDFQTGFNVFFAFTYSIVVILVPFLVICVIYGCIYCAAHRNSERMRKSNSGSSTTNLDTYIQIPLDENRLKVKVNSSDNISSSEPASEIALPKVKSAPNFAHLETGRLSGNKGTTGGGLLLEESSCQSTPVKCTGSNANSLRSNSSFINSLKTKISNASLFKYREETRAAKISILVIFMVLVCYVPYGLALVINTRVFPRSVTSPHSLNAISLALLVLANLFSPFLFAYRNRRIQRELRKLLGFSTPRDRGDMRSLRDRTIRRHSFYRPGELKSDALPRRESSIPEVVVSCKMEVEKKSILKRVCSKGKNWGVAKRCNFIPVPDSCLSVDCRCSFSSASTQISSEDYSACS